MLESTDEILAKKMRGQIESWPENNNKPVVGMASRTGGEGKDKTFRSPGEEVRLNAVRPAAMPAGGEADRFDLEEGLDTDDCVVLEGSVVTGLSEVVGIR